MFKLTFEIPEAVLYDTHMTKLQSEKLAKKIIAMHYYLHFHISLGYCVQIADTTEEDFIKYLGENNISIFKFEDKQEFLDELENACIYSSTNISSTEL